MTEHSISTDGFLTARLERWLTALIILATVAVAFVVINFTLSLIAYFSDVIMIFFLAWLLMFILSPLANALLHLFPRLPRAIAVVIIYAVLVAALLVAAVVVAQQLSSNISSLIDQWKNTTPEELRQRVQPLQNWLNSVGLGQIDVAKQSSDALNNLQTGASQLVKPLSDIALASIGVLGNVLFIFFLSLFMAVDRDRIVSFLFRLVPPAYTDEARLLEHSVSRSFGGFLRGQATTGLIYGGISMLASLLLGLPYMPVTAVTSGVLQAIPFFGPFFSWIPPVAVALLFRPDAALPALVIMVVGWFVLMNIIQPRLMSEAVGLHPVVVLGSVMVGSKLAGVAGAIFGIPVAAVVASFFFYYLARRPTESGSVAARAARRVEQREGRPIRVPRLPQPGEDEEVVHDDRGAAKPATGRLRFPPSFRPSGFPLAQARPMGRRAERDAGADTADPPAIEKATAPEGEPPESGTPEAAG